MFGRRSSEELQNQENVNADGATDSFPSEQSYSEDDGKFTKGNVGDEHYHNVFDRNSRAANGLRDGEQGAAKMLDQKDDGILGARESENNIKSGFSSPTSSFKNMVSGRSDNEQAKGKSKFSARSLMKKMMPALVAGGGVAGFGALSFFGQMAMPISLINQFIGNFDSISVSNYARSSRFTKWQMHSESRNVSAEAQDFVKQHSKIYQLATGSDENYFKISKRQAAKLKKSGINVVSDGAGNQIMRYTNADGNEVEIVADKAQAKNGRITIDELYETDSGFRNSYYEGTKTWRQSLGSWFDNLTGGFLTKISVMRNRFSDFSTGGDDSKAEYEGTVKSAVGGDDVSGSTGGGGLRSEEETTKNDDGTDTTKDVAKLEDGDGTSVSIKRGSSASEISTKLLDFADGIGQKSVKVAGKISGTICFVTNIVGAINLLIMANEALQVLRVATTVFEGIQKGQIEDSKSSPINDIANSLTTKKKTTYNTANGDGGTTSSDGSAMEANAISALYGNTAVDDSDPSVNSFNLTDGITQVLSHFGGNLASYSTCLVSKIAAGLVSAGVDVAKTAGYAAELVACIGGGAETLGLACLPLLGNIAFNIGKEIVVSAAFSSIVGMVTSFVGQYLVPKAATMLTRDLAADIGGEDFGNALVSGANMYMGQNHQYGGGSVASKETLITYLKQQEVYIADVARYERETLSPFDASSPYTFMGDLLSKSVPVLTQTGSIMSGITNVSSLVGKSISSLIPGASAVTAATTAEEAAKNTESTCPELASIGAVGDAFCNPYFITDLSTMDEDPAEVIYKVSELGSGENFVLSDDEDNPKINTATEPDAGGSRLMEYIVYCSQRTSNFGVADQNIGNAIDSGAGTLEGALPIWGGVADVLQSTNIFNKIGYVTGEACVTKNSGDGIGSNAFTWEEASYYQRYIEDQRIAENEGIIEKSSVTVALENYYEEHPIDDSYEGVLASRMGVTKEYLAKVMDTMEGLLWLAQYDPSDMYPYKVTDNDDESRVAIRENQDIEVENYDSRRSVFNLSMRNEFAIGN